MAPTKMATSISLKASTGSAVGITSVCVCVWEDVWRVCGCVWEDVWKVCGYVWGMCGVYVCV